MSSVKNGLMMQSHECLSARYSICFCNSSGGLMEYIRLQPSYMESVGLNMSSFMTLYVDGWISTRLNSVFFILSLSMLLGSSIFPTPTSTILDALL